MSRTSSYFDHNIIRSVVYTQNFNNAYMPIYKKHNHNNDLWIFRQRWKDYRKQIQTWLDAGSYYLLLITIKKINSKILPICAVETVIKNKHNHLSQKISSCHALLLMCLLQASSLKIFFLDVLFLFTQIKSKLREFSWQNFSKICIISENQSFVMKRQKPMLWLTFDDTVYSKNRISTTIKNKTKLNELVEYINIRSPLCCCIPIKIQNLTKNRQ